MDGELEQLGERIAEQAAHFDAALHRLLADLREFDQRGGWYRQGAMTCAHWLSWRVGWDLVTARERVRVANKLGDFPTIDDALRRGEISYSKVRALMRVATPSNETLLLDHARLMTASQLEKLSRKYALVQRHYQDPHPMIDEHRRFVRRRDTEDGMVKIEATLHPEEAELVWTMLNHAATRLARESTSPAHPDSAESTEPVQLTDADPCQTADSAESPVVLDSHSSEPAPGEPAPGEPAPGEQPSTERVLGAPGPHQPAPSDRGSSAPMQSADADQGQTADSAESREAEATPTQPVQSALDDVEPDERRAVERRVGGTEIDPSRSLLDILLDEADAMRAAEDSARALEAEAVREGEAEADHVSSRDHRTSGGCESSHEAAGRDATAIVNAAPPSGRVAATSGRHQARIQPGRCPGFARAELRARRSTEPFTGGDHAHDLGRQPPRGRGGPPRGG